MSNKMKGNILLLITAMLWGTTFIGQKLGLTVLPTALISAFRLSVSAIVLMPLVIIDLKKTNYISKDHNTYEQRRNKIRDIIVGGFFCGISITAATNFQSLGLKTIDAGKAGFITSLYIVLVPIFALFLGKKLKLKSAACIALAVLGFGLLCIKDGFGSVCFGDLMVLVAAAFFAIQILVINHFINSKNGLYLSVAQMFFGGIVGWILTLTMATVSMEDFLRCLPVLIYLALFPACLGYTLQIIGLKYTDATTGSLLTGLESVFSAIYGALILGESMTTKEILGCVIIFAACALIQIEKKPAQASDINKEEG